MSAFVVLAERSKLRCFQLIEKTLDEKDVHCEFFKYCMTCPFTAYFCLRELIYVSDLRRET